MTIRANLLSSVVVGLGFLSLLTITKPATAISISPIAGSSVFEDIPITPLSSVPGPNGFTDFSFITSNETFSVDLGQLVYGGIVAVGEPGDPLFDLNNSNTWSDALIFGNGIAGSITNVLHFFSDPFVPQGIQATQTLVGFETDNPDFIQYFSGGTRGANNDYFIRTLAN